MSSILALLFVALLIYPFLRLDFSMLRFLFTGANFAEFDTNFNQQQRQQYAKYQGYGDSLLSGVEILIRSFRFHFENDGRGYQWQRGGFHQQHHNSLAQEKAKRVEAFRTLGIAESALPRQIKNAFRSLSLKWYLYLIIYYPCGSFSGTLIRIKETRMPRKSI
jgi:hypothetical protein